MSGRKRHPMRSKKSGKAASIKSVRQRQASAKAPPAHPAKTDYSFTPPRVPAGLHADNSAGKAAQKKKRRRRMAREFANAESQQQTSVPASEMPLDDPVTLPEMRAAPDVPLIVPPPLMEQVKPKNTRRKKRQAKNAKKRRNYQSNSGTERLRFDRDADVPNNTQAKESLGTGKRTQNHFQAFRQTSESAPEHETVSTVSGSTHHGKDYPTPHTEDNRFHLETAPLTLLQTKTDDEAQETAVKNPANGGVKEGRDRVQKLHFESARLHFNEDSPIPQKEAHNEEFPHLLSGSASHAHRRHKAGDDTMQASEVEEPLYKEGRRPVREVPNTSKLRFRHKDDVAQHTGHTQNIRVPESTYPTADTPLAQTPIPPVMQTNNAGQSVAGESAATDKSLDQAKPVPHRLCFEALESADLQATENQRNPCEKPASQKKDTTNQKWSRKDVPHHKWSDRQADRAPTKRRQRLRFEDAEIQPEPKVVKKENAEDVKTGGAGQTRHYSRRGILHGDRTGAGKRGYQSGQQARK